MTYDNVMETETAQTKNLTTFWILVNIFLAPPTSNRRSQCIDHFLSGQF